MESRRTVNTSPHLSLAVASTYARDGGAVRAPQSGQRTAQSDGVGMYPGPGGKLSVSLNMRLSMSWNKVRPLAPSVQ